MRRRGRLGGSALVAVLAIAGLAALPSSASAVTFGANLNRAPDNPTTCGTFGFTSCTFESINPVTGESGFPPVGTGVVTLVRVRVGPITGPMQIVVEQALRRDNPIEPGRPTYACCQALNASQVFTPAANSITEVPVRLFVRQDIAPDPATGFYVDQHLALSVLSPNVPIPASSDPNAGYSGWFPAWTVGQERCCPFGGAGATILFNAEWQSCPGAQSSVAESSKKRKGKKKKKKKKRSACGTAKKKKKGKKGKKKRARRA